jgi:hypothetical protein
MLGTLPKYKTPLPTDKCHPELDDSPLLDESDHKHYMMLIGMAQWVNVLGRIDICHAVSTLSQFNATPRQGHLQLARHIWGYLKKFPHHQLVARSEPMVLHKDALTGFITDFSDEYKDAQEEIDPGLPPPRGKPLETFIFFDSDHAHNKVTRRSLTGCLVVVGSTPIYWISKRQGAIASSTYQAEFMAARMAVEEAIAIRYMLRSLGVPVTRPTLFMGDNKSVMTNVGNADSQLQKKHVAISYHLVREAVAAKIILPFHIAGDHNPSDILTKMVATEAFHRHARTLLTTTPDKDDDKD